MFKFLKEKLQRAILKTSEKIDKEGETALREEPVEKTSDKETPCIDSKNTGKKEGFFSKLFKKKDKEEKTEEKRQEEEAAYAAFEVKKEESSESNVPENEPVPRYSEEQQDDFVDLVSKAELVVEEEQEKKVDEKELFIALEDLDRPDKIREEIEKQKKNKEPAPRQKVPSGKPPDEDTRVTDKKPEQKFFGVKEDDKQAEEACITRAEERMPAKQHEAGKKEGFLERITKTITTKKINEKQFDDLFFELEVILLENNVAVEVIDKIKSGLKDELVDKPIQRGQIEKTIERSLKTSINSLFVAGKKGIHELINQKREKPYVISFFGINGSGKTTSIAKIADMLKKKGITSVIAAADTFRAAAIDQLQLHADKINVKLIKHDYGSDPAAVAFDAIKHAKAKNIDVVLIDTAGRMHSNSNLMDEMKKIIRVANPDLKVFVGEAITGNDCTEQAKKFDDSVGIDGIILTKADVDEKGGASISVSYVTKKPILYIGTGQDYSDIKEFDPSIIVESLGLDA